MMLRLHSGLIRSRYGGCCNTPLPVLEPTRGQRESRIRRLVTALCELQFILWARLLEACAQVLAVCLLEHQPERHRASPAPESTPGETQPPPAGAPGRGVPVQDLSPRQDAGDRGHQLQTDLRTAAGSVPDRSTAVSQGLLAGGVSRLQFVQNAAHVSGNQGSRRKRGART